MKNLIFTTALTIFCLTAFGQSRLGSSADDIKTEFYETNFNLKSGFDENNYYYITISIERAIVTYYFNTDKICTLTVIIPDNQGALNFYVEQYNKKYVIVSTTEWKMYSKGGISNIQLIYPDSGGYYFLWTNE
jgi:hypothetical protein